MIDDDAGKVDIATNYPKVIAFSMESARKFRDGAMNADYEPSHREWLAHLADLQARWAREMNHRMLRERRQTSRQMGLTI